MGGFEFTPFDQGTYSSHLRSPSILDDDVCVAELTAVVFYQALDTTVKWFVENYDNARTGKKA